MDLQGAEAHPEPLVSLHKKIKFSIKDFFSKRDQILQIWSHLLEKSLCKTSFSCSVEHLGWSFLSVFAKNYVLKSPLRSSSPYSRYSVFLIFENYPKINTLWCLTKTFSCGFLLIIPLSHLVSTKKSYTLKQTCSFSMY